MFAARFFPSRFYAPRYFAKTGLTLAFLSQWAEGSNQFIGSVIPQVGR